VCRATRGGQGKRQKKRRGRVALDAGVGGVEVGIKKIGGVRREVGKSGFFKIRNAKG
jgi:hypothetical protein